MTAQPYTDPDIGKTPKQLFAERNKRVQGRPSVEAARPHPYSTRHELHVGRHVRCDRPGTARERGQEKEMLEKAALYFRPDIILGVFNNPLPSLAWGTADEVSRPRWHGRERLLSVLEGEYMKGEDYDAFIDDPADWTFEPYGPASSPS